MEKINIILLAKNIDGGTGSFFTSILQNKNVVFNGHNVYPLVLEKPNYRKIPKNIRITYFKNNGYYPKIFNFSPFVFHKLAKEFFWFKSIVTQIKPLCIMTVDTHCSLLAGFYKLFINKSVIVGATIHNNVEDTLVAKTDWVMRPLVKQLIHLIFNRIEFVVCVSKDLAINIKKYFNLKIKPQVVYYGIKKPDLKSTKQLFNNKYLVSVG
jgi:glycosyltransferase involved in cell wall biosynthesis